MRPEPSFPTESVRRGSRHAMCLACGIALAAGYAAASAQSVRPVAFAPAPAAADRQSIRAQILLDEREQLRERLVEARMRLADRIRAGDPAGIDDARRAITRTEDALESIGREIEREPARVTVRPAGTPRPTNPPGPAQVERLAPFVAALPAPLPVPAPAPWWDVYGAGSRARASDAPPAGTEPSQP